jgi:hypothetical protein
MLPTEPHGPVTVIGEGSKRFRPIYSADLIAALTAARTLGTPGTYDLAGPESLFINEIVHHLKGPDVTIKQMPVAAAEHIPGLPHAVIDLFTKPGREPDPTTAWHMLDITPTPLATIWRPTVHH